MSDPLVVAVMLTKDRPQMAARAFRSWWLQTSLDRRYGRRTNRTPSSLLIWDTGMTPLVFSMPEDQRYSRWHSVRREYPAHVRIGTLRNHAVEYAVEVLHADILCHFDDDDVSHPLRIAEQVALLQSSGADAVGYREGLFWDIRGQEGHVGHANGAWLYSASAVSGNVIGASLCYRVATWCKYPFLPGTSQGEEQPMVNGCDGEWMSSMSTRRGSEPRMVCGIHGGNTSHYGAEHLRTAREWTWAPIWDKWCAETMKL